MSRVSVCVCHHGNPASWWNGDFWSKGILLILENLEFFFVLFQWLFWFSIFVGLGVFANQPTVHIGGASRRRVCGCGCWCWWNMTCDMWYVSLGRIQFCVNHPYMLADVFIVPFGAMINHKQFQSDSWTPSWPKFAIKFKMGITSPKTEYP